MKKTIADALRSLARRLDPPPSTTTHFTGNGILVHVYGVPSVSSNEIAPLITWAERTTTY